MTCQEFWNSENQDASGHLEECAACAAAWDREQALLLGLRIVRSQNRAIRAPERVERRLVAAFQGYAGLGGQVVPIRKQIWVPVATWFAAAAALGTVALLLIREPAPKPVPRGAPNAMHFAAVPAFPEIQGGQQSEISADDFIPLPNAAEFDANEEMNLVRLEFPRSAMLALGFEMNSEDEGDPVSADVMIGPDGVARAVRFLEE